MQDKYAGVGVGVGVGVTHFTQITSVFGTTGMHRSHIMLWFELSIRSSHASTLEIRSEY